MFHLNDQQHSCKTTTHATQLRATLHKSGKPIDFAYRATFLRRLEISVSAPAWGTSSRPPQPV